MIVSQAEIPREQFLREILARMSLTCHEEIGRVGRVRRGCYEEILLPCNLSLRAFTIGLLLTLGGKLYVQVLCAWARVRCRVS